MKAFLLAAGLGTRLGSITQTIPKCLLPIKGTPVLEIWLQRLFRFGITQVLVNTHHLHDQVENYVKSRIHPPEVVLSYEAKLLGSAGTLQANRSFVESEDFFLVCYVDTWTPFDLSIFINQFKARKSEKPLGMALLYQTDNPTQNGIATMDERGWIQSFVEKPKNPTSNLANTGIYIFTKESLEFLPQKVPADIAQDFFPQLVPQLLGFKTDASVIDIGTPENYHLVTH